MCCFTGPVKSVSGTKIFAHAEDQERQFLIYSMIFEADRELAMVLPLPVKPGTGEDGVTFISLKEYPYFFDDMERGFPQPDHLNFQLSHGMSAALATRAAPLPVFEVGSFEASFVPTAKDFSRVDDRFRLPEETWRKLPGYHDYGFAVFKLKPGQQVHPMAFSFPRRDSHSLFFPTVHIHDGHVHKKAEFDHVLYCQPREGEPLKFGLIHHWRESNSHAGSFITLPKAKKMVEADQHCYRRELKGNLPNRDTFVALES